jgi:Lysyl oxidase
MNHRRVLTTLAILAAIVLVNSAAGFAQTDLLPNLVPRPASEISVVQDLTNNHILLRFAGVNTNVGDGPLELRPGGLSGSGQDVYQRIYRSDGTYYDRFAGTMTYHPQHNHFHFNNFARYTLTRLGDTTGSGQTSEKTSFCVEDTTAIDLRLPGAPQNGVYTTCSATVQGLSVGWGDRYGPSLAGQSIDITGDPEGDYELVIQTDPGQLGSDPADGGQLLETNELDNSSCIRLHINSAARTFQALGICGAVNVYSITPSTIKPGTWVNVTITGDGFTPGIAVGFENGGGPAPVISNVFVVNATTITATVTVKNGGGKQSRVWDLRVGSGTLLRAFTVKQ